jgi:hypothetical protein
MRARRPSADATPAQICTVGPSRPRDAPLPIWIVETKNLPAASRRRTRPAFRPYDAFTCGMPLPRAFGNAYFKRMPATTPPRVGSTSIHTIHHVPVPVWMRDVT